MKTLAIITTIWIAALDASANTVVVVSVQRCSSLPHTIIEVTRLGKRVSSAHLDVYREIEHGEQPTWAGTTDKKGVATPPGFEPGEYRIVADVGALSSTMLLHVAASSETSGKCEIKLDPPDAPKIANPLPEPTASIQMREFAGVVQDESGAVIPRAIIRILRKSSDKQDVASTLSDKTGRFTMNLGTGKYLAVVQVQGFRTQVVSLRIAKDGWHAVQLTMEAANGQRSTAPQKLDSPN